MPLVTQLLGTAAAGTVLILVTALLRRALKKCLPPEVWLVLWAICLFRLLTPAVPESPLSLYALPRLLPAVPAAAAPAPTGSVSAPSVPAPSIPTPAPAPGGAVLPPETAAHPLPGVVSPAPTPTAPPVQAGPALDPETPLGTALAAIWLLGAAVTALRLVLEWRRTRRAVRSAPLLPRSDPRYAALPPGVRLREGPVEGAPLTFGVVRPTVVLSPGLSGDALACVLAHEGVHVRRRDNLWHYAVALARTVFWWDPAVWLMAKLLRRDIELSCDRAALRRLGLDRRREYAMTILDLSIQGEGMPFSRAFGQKEAEERILAIMKYKKVTALALVLSILLVCGVTAAFATEPVDNADEPVLAETEPAETDPVHTEPVETKPVESASLPDRIEYVADGGIIVIDTNETHLLAKELVGALSAHYNIEMISADSASQSGCTHPNLEKGKSWQITWCTELNKLEHNRFELPGYICPDCGTYASGDSSTASVTQESHTFGPNTYMGADHSSANPAKHVYTYGQTCTLCGYTSKYTLPIGCTGAGCIGSEAVSVGDRET